MIYEFYTEVLHTVRYMTVCLQVFTITVAVYLPTLTIRIIPYSPQ